MHLSLTSLAVLADYGGPLLQGGCVARSIPIVQDAFEGPLLALHDRLRRGPLAAVMYFARNCPHLRTLHLPPMDATRLDMDSEELLPSDPPAHRLQRLVVSKLKIGAQGGSAQSIKSMTEFVGNVFPRAAWALSFREERVTVAEGWAVAHENTRCIDCHVKQTSTGAF